jgi:uncharacterized repeat protein (TIGR02543 family)
MFMKKASLSLSLVMVFLAAFMFSGCPGEEDAETTITLSPTTLSVEVGESKTLTATTNPAGKAVTWSSSDTTKATVVNGSVTGVAEGGVTITASADGKQATCAVTVTKASVEVVGQTLVHTAPKLEGVEYFGSDLGTTNAADGSYTFADGTSGSPTQYNGGGAQYAFPAPKVGDSWTIDDYDIVEITLVVTDGEIDVIVKKPATAGGNSVDLLAYPNGGGQYLDLRSTVSDGKYTFKTVVAEGKTGIGFQRNGNTYRGPATVAIEKVVFSKGTIHTITFAAGTNTTTWEPIDPIKIIDGRTVNLGSGDYTSYQMPPKPRRIDADNVFTGWYNTTDSEDFNPTKPVTKNLTLTAQWGEPPEPPPMELDLNPANWDTLPTTVNSNNAAWPTELATTVFENNKLTITFNGKNRQRAIIPLDPDQIDWLIKETRAGVNFVIVGEITDDNGGVGRYPGETTSARFRCHLGHPEGDPWNGTDTGLETAIQEHMTEYRSFSSNKSSKMLSYFMMQAMYRDPDTGVTNDTTKQYPIVTMVIESITIEPVDELD